MTCTELETRLDAWLDGDLAPGEHEAVAAHLAGCPACAALHTDLVALRERARAAPREVAPPPAVWEAVARVASHESRGRSPAPWRPWLLAAAAVALVVASSLATVLVLRERDSRLVTRDSTVAALAPRLAALLA